MLLAMYNIPLNYIFGIYRQSILGSNIEPSLSTYLTICNLTIT